MNQNETLSDLVRKIVNIRDKNKPCIICGQSIRIGETTNACHYVKASKSTLFKWDLRNVNRGHETCNNAEENDINLHICHASYLMDRHGVDILMILNRDKNKTAHFSKSDKAEMINRLKQILKELS